MQWLCTSPSGKLGWNLELQILLTRFTLMFGDCLQSKLLGKKSTMWVSLMIIQDGPTYNYWQWKTKFSKHTGTLRPVWDFTLGSRHSKSCTLIEEENIWANNSANTSHRRGLNTNLMCMRHYSIMECLSASTEPSLNKCERCYTQVSFLKSLGRGDNSHCLVKK